MLEHPFRKFGPILAPWIEAYAPAGPGPQPLADEAATGRRNPRGNNGRIDTPDETPEQRLNRLFAGQSASATPEQREAVQRWQEKDNRFYREVQQAAQNQRATQLAYQVMDDLQDLMAPLPEDVEVWRGIRNSVAVFGVPPAEIENLIGGDGTEVPMFFATSLARNVATTEFTTPGPYPVLYKITAQMGTPTIWVPPLGRQNDAYQQEILFPPAVVVRILGVDRRRSVPVVEAEVNDG